MDTLRRVVIKIHQLLVPFVCVVMSMPARLEAQPQAMDLESVTKTVSVRGQSFPMNLNEQVVRPLLGNVGVIGLFFIPMITMRVFAEEKRSGTIELLATSPVRDIEVIVGKWLAAVALYAINRMLSQEKESVR